MNVRIRTYDEQRERTEATFDEAQLVVIETVGGTFWLKERDGVLHLSAYNGQLVIRPRASNLIRLEEIP